MADTERLKAVEVYDRIAAASEKLPTGRGELPSIYLMTKPNWKAKTRSVNVFEVLAVMNIKIIDFWDVICYKELYLLGYNAV
jgi:hypothetical protein